MMQNKLGGGEGIEGLYGSLTRTGMAKVLHSLSKSCGLDQTSRLVDVGAGLGRSADAVSHFANQLADSDI